MPSMEQLDSMAKQLRLGQTFSSIPQHSVRIEVMTLTIAAIQAKALADMAYLQGFKGG
jgi:hypothetical protein